MSFGNVARLGGERIQNLKADDAACAQQFLRTLGVQLLVAEQVHEDVRVERSISPTRVLTTESEPRGQRPLQPAKSGQRGLAPPVAADFELAFGSDTDLDVVLDLRFEAADSL